MSAMIELTNGYKGVRYPKFLVNPRYVIHAVRIDGAMGNDHVGVNCSVEYVGGAETQTVWVTETYEQVCEMLRGHC